MIFNNTKVFNFEGAFSGVERKLTSDSYFWNDGYHNREKFLIAGLWTNLTYPKFSPMIHIVGEAYEDYLQKADWLSKNESARAYIGPRDMKIVQKLLKDNRNTAEAENFFKQIIISAEIEAEKKWWDSFEEYFDDTYAGNIHEGLDQSIYGTIVTNYNNVARIYKVAKKNNLIGEEWEEFYTWVEKLPYSKELITSI